MTSVETGSAREGERLMRLAVTRSLSWVLWLVGLISTLYLVGSALVLLFLAVVFLPGPSNDLTVLDKAGMVAMNAVPACCYAAIGIVGLTLWPSSRFRLWGLAAIVVEAALAIDVYADPANLPPFTGWLL